MAETQATSELPEMMPFRYNAEDRSAGSTALGHSQPICKSPKLSIGLLMRQFSTKCKWYAGMATLLILISYAVKSIESTSVAVGAEAKDSILGSQIQDFTLRDFRGKEHSLSDFDDQRLIVAYFMGTECPLVKLYAPRMERLHEKYASRGVAFIAISSNVQDSITELAAHARTTGLTFPILKDLQNRVADQFQATRTPQVFLLDQERRIRYYGRVDGQYTFGSGVGLAQPQPKRNDLSIAIDELLADKKVSVPVTEAKGCIIGRARAAREDSEVTYSNQIARIFQQRCVECHREGQIAPFALSEYDEIAGWGEMIAEVVREQRMPPWHANPAHGEFANANRLSDEEKKTIYDWVDNGCPEGDPADLPAPLDFHEGWFMGQEPDQIIYMTDEPVQIKAEGVENYRYYVVDPGFKEDKWVRLVECMPGNRAVVHHIIVYIKSPEAKDSGIGKHELLAGFAPGTRPLIAPEGWARRIPANSQLIFEMHYTPIGTVQTDRSSIGLVFMDEEDVTHQTWTTNAIETRFEIPPHADNYQVQARRIIKQEVQLLSLFPHMHMRGKSFRYELFYPDGRHEILLDVPQYDFNWQSSFVLAKPMSIPQGSEILCTAHYDNSEANLANPDPTQAVRWGEQTWDEMMIGWYDVAVRREN